MLTNLQILTADGLATSDGVFIPTTDIAGLTGAEINDTGATLEGKLAYGFLNGFFAALAITTPLGFTESDKTSPTGTGDNSYIEGIEVVIQRLLDLRAGTFTLPPIPSTGTHTGQGKLLLTDVWENCQIILSGASTGGAGVIIPDAWIQAHGGDLPMGEADDARSWFAALLLAMAATLTVRTTTVNSAITSTQNLVTNRVAGALIPTAWYDDTNPLVDLTAADLPFMRLTQERIKIDYELLTDPLAQTFEINVRTL